MTIKLTILGTGTFFVNKDRSASAYLLELDNKKILIDCGPGTLIKLSEIGVKPEDIDFLFITHFHADHVADLFPFFMNLRLDDLFSKGASIKFPQVIGPEGLNEFMARSCQNFQILALKDWDKMKFSDVLPEQQIGNIKIQSFKVTHIAFGLAANAYAYRFTLGDKVIAFSGDSARCPGVEEVCVNADIFICDTSYAKGGSNTAHIDTYDVGTIAQKGKVKKVILTHLYPQTDNIDLVQEVKEKYSGEVIRGTDLMTFEL